MAPLLIQLQSNQDKYRNLLDGMMMEKVSDDGGLQELQAITSLNQDQIAQLVEHLGANQKVLGSIPGLVRGLQDASYVAEQLSGKSCLLALHPIDEANVEEAVLQSVTLTGLGTEGFDVAQPYFRAGGHLRDWTPGRDGQDLILMFGNRYLTSSHDTGDNVSIEMSPIVDPLNILCPLIKNEVHTADNVVEYWERRGVHSTSEVYIEIKPGLFTLTNLVELQVSFAIIRIACQEYTFVPKLWAICLLDRIVEMDYNLSTIHVLASGQLSPLKKIKRKVSYRMSSSDESAPNKQLRHLILGEVEGAVGRTDMSMKEVA
ncbi:hypothetical protein V8D89_014345 [Ganoderma adspersum]